MHLENFNTPTHVRSIDHHLPIKTPRSEQGRVKDIRPVGRSDQDHTFCRIKSIHLDEQLIERLFPFVMTSAQPCSTKPTNGIDFVDKNNAGSMFFPLLEEIANTGRSDADKHFHEIRSTDTEERHAGFTGNGLGQQRFACTGRTDDQDALGNAAT